MMIYITSIFLTCLSLLIRISFAFSHYCSQEFSVLCFCGEEEFNNKQQYVVNCTDTGFTNANMLQGLPQEAQVLIFTGNNISELPLNIFGTQNNTNLKIIDMSNNHIKTVRGKSFHHVLNVERLILNHNEISISSSEPLHHHPRIFSNFENLLELHLTDAFADNSPEGLASDLHDIFVSSDLSKLRKLHLEQNEISQFQDSKVFCDLPSLQDLHLGQNALQSLRFEFDCLKNLRYLDLESNLFYSFSSKDLSKLDVFPSRKQNLTIDISDNPLTCNCDELYNWMKNTNVTVRNINKLHCRKSLQSLSPHCEPKFLQFNPSSVMNNNNMPLVNNHMFLITLLFITLCVSISINVYSNKEYLRHTFQPALHAVTKKVHYTTIGKPEEPEMDV